MRSSSGNAIAEYGLIALLVLVSIIGVTRTLAKSTNNALAALKGDMSATVQSAATARPAAPSISTATVSITLQDGKTITLSNYPTNMAQSIATTGTNGSTELLANTMQSLSEQLLAQGAITQTQYNALIKVSNATFEMARVETALDQSLQGINGESTFRNGTFTYNGQPYSIDQLSYLVGWGNNVVTGVPPSGVSGPGDGSLPGGALSSLLDAYRAAQASGATSDPTISALMATMMNQVVLMGDSLNDRVATQWYGTYDQATIVNTAHDAGTFTQTTIQSAQGVCSLGNGTSQNLHCTTNG